MVKDSRKLFVSPVDICDDGGGAPSVLAAQHGQNWRATDAVFRRQPVITHAPDLLLHGAPAVSPFRHLLAAFVTLRI